MDFKEGRFFTLLTEGSNLERLYEFKDGIIFPQNPLIRNGNSCYSITPTIDNELSELIHQKVNSQRNLKAVFDDVLRNTQDFIRCDFSKKDLEELIVQPITKFHIQELYYIVDANNSSAKLVHRCLDKSHAFWHSLCVITTLKHLPERELSLEDLKKICSYVEAFIVCAYDGEGYVFWEKSRDFFC